MPFDPVSSSIPLHPLLIDYILHSDDAPSCQILHSDDANLVDLCHNGMQAASSDIFGLIIDFRRFLGNLENGIFIKD